MGDDQVLPTKGDSEHRKTFSEQIALYVGLAFGGVQTTGALLGFPNEIKIPLVLGLIGSTLCTLAYFRSGVKSSTFRLSLAGSLVAVVICVVLPAAIKLHERLGQEPTVYYISVTVFADANANGVKDPIDRPLTHIMVNLSQRDRLDNSGIYPKETDDVGQAQLTLPRAGKSVLRVCGETQQVDISTDATAPSRTQHFHIGVPPYLIDRCEKP